MSTRILPVVLAAVVSLAGLVACSNDPTVHGEVTNGSNLVFKQVDRLGRPGLKELYLAYSLHDAFDRAIPENDPSAYGSQVASFVTGRAGRSTAIATLVESLLTPDALIVNLNDTSGQATYLAWETANTTGTGQIHSDCTGLLPTGFGGRALSDDVVSVMLGLSFGNLATAATLTAGSTLPNIAGSVVPPDDGKEQNGQNGTNELATQNVSCTAKVAAVTPQQFPYLAAPAP